MVRITRSQTDLGLWKDKVVFIMDATQRIGSHFTSAISHLCVIAKNAYKWHVKGGGVRGVTIHKSHDSVRTSGIKSRFDSFFGTVGLKLYFYQTLIFSVDLIYYIVYFSPGLISIVVLNTKHQDTKDANIVCDNQ